MTPPVPMRSRRSTVASSPPRANGTAPAPNFAVSRKTDYTGPRAVSRPNEPNLHSKAPPTAAHPRPQFRTNPILPKAPAPQNPIPRPLAPHSRPPLLTRSGPITMLQSVNQKGRRLVFLLKPYAIIDL